MSHPLYENLFELIHLAIDMKRTGIPIDEEARDFEQRRLAKARGEAELNFLDLVEESGYNITGFNIGSPKQISALYYEHLGLKPRKAYLSKTTGLPGVPKSALRDAIIEGDRTIREISKYLIDFRENDKYESTYTGQGYFLEEGHYGLKVFRRDRRVHFSWSPGAAETWRSTGDGQQVPKHVYDANGNVIRSGLRHLYKAPDGYTLIEADYSQQELRKVALYSGCQPLIHELTRPGGDAHGLFTRAMFQIPDAVYDKKKHKGMRDLGKTLVFACLLYGGKAETGWRQVAPKYPSLTVQFIENAKELTYKAMPELPAYQNDQIKFAKDRGYTPIPNTPYVIRWRFGPINNQVVGDPENSEVINKRIQTSCAIMMNAAMMRVQRALYKLSPLIKIVLQVHDALFVFAPNHLAEKAAAIIRAEMEQEERYLVMYKMFYPVDIKMGKYWGDCPYCRFYTGDAKLKDQSKCECLKEVKV